MQSHGCRIRGACRSHEVAECRELESQGVSMQMLNVAEAAPSELATLFQGAEAAFLMTDSDDPSTCADETACGIKLVQAAAEAKIKHLVFSSMPNVRERSGGRLQVPSWTHKAEIADFIRHWQHSAAQRPFETVTFVRPGFYYQNLTKYFRPVREGDHVRFTLPELYRELAAFNIEDLGDVVCTILKNPKLYDGNTFALSLSTL